jgi:branched-chain amino acid transport system ATP-binding protein
MSDTGGGAGAQLLSLERVTKQFGGVVAVNDVSFQVARTSVTGLIGPNGSGKTTLINVINGVHPADRGTVRLAGTALNGKEPSALAAGGVSRTFQAPRVFNTLTVQQNLFIPLLHQARVERAAAAERAAELLRFVGLDRFAEQIASELSGGQKRLLEFARALVTRPSLILMDEPFAGVHPAVKALLIRCIRETIARDGSAFLIVSHEVPDLVAMADVMVCLVEGKVAAHGAPDAVVRDERVIEGYLGRGGR